MKIDRPITYLKCSTSMFLGKIKKVTVYCMTHRLKLVIILTVMCISLFRYNFIFLDAIVQVTVLGTIISNTLLKKCPYSGLFWSEIFPHLDFVFSPNAGKCGKNAGQNNSEYGHFLRTYLSIFSLNAGKCVKNADQNNSPNTDIFYAVISVEKSVFHSDSSPV